MNRTTTRTQRRFVAALLTAVAVAGLTACGNPVEDAVNDAASDVESQVAEADAAVDEVVEAVEELDQVVPGGGAGAEAGAGPDLFTAAGLAEVTAAAYAEVGADDPQLTELAVYPDHLAFSAVDPAAPAELNSFTWINGGNGPVAPVDYGGDVEALEANLFASSEVDPAVVEAFVGTALEASEVEDGEVTHVIVKRGLPFTEDVQVLAYVSSNRDHAMVTGDLTGNVTDVA